MKGTANMIFLYVFLALLGLFIAITLVRAIFFVPKKRDLAPLEKENVDVDRYRKHLSEAIRIKTVSYVDRDKVDWAEFEKFKNFLLTEYPNLKNKLTLEIIGKSNLVFRWKGKDSSLDPIALLSHQDVVPVESGTEGDWEHPAFDGVDDGEYIWGRGALDMKNHLIAVVEAVETLLEENFEPERDVYLLFGENEEVMSTTDSGAMLIAKHFEEKGIHFDSVIDEGGAMLPINIKGVLENKYLAGVGVAEKGYADYEVSVKSKGGHSSQPPNHTAVGKLADVIKDIEKHQFKSTITPSVFKLFTSIGKNCTYPVRIFACNLWLLKPIVKAIMKRIPPAASLIRSTTGITMAKGSPTANVLPQIASVTANFRMMPGTSLKDVETHIRKVVRNKDIEVALLKGKEPSKFSPTDSRTFKIIEELSTRNDENIIIAPFLVMGGTDACHYQNVCENIYRFAPFKVSTQLLLTTHSTNERLPVACIEESVSFFKRYIRLASQG